MILFISTKWKQAQHNKQPPHFGQTPLCRGSVLPRVTIEEILESRRNSCHICPQQLWTVFESSCACMSGGENKDKFSLTFLWAGLEAAGGTDRKINTRAVDKETLRMKPVLQQCVSSSPHPASQQVLHYPVSGWSWLWMEKDCVQLRVLATLSHNNINSQISKLRK